MDNIYKENIRILKELYQTYLALKRKNFNDNINYVT